MKRIIYAVLAGSIMLASCSKNEIVKGTDSQPTISFNSYVNRLTKAVDADLNTIKNGFTVYGYYQAAGESAGVFTPNFFNGSVVSYNNGWNYSDTKYWPLDGTIDFIALGNNCGSFSTDATGAKISYTGSNDPSAQKDLLVAVAEGTSKANNALNGVDLQFKHALSRIDVSVKNTTGDASLKLVIKSIKFLTVKPNGTYAVASKSWASSGTAATNAIGLKGAIEQLVNASGFLSVNNAEGALIIVPQSQTKIEVEYEYYQAKADNSGYIKVADCTGANKKTISLSGNWASDTKYTYQLAFGDLSDLTAIKFTAQVSDWTNTVNE